MSEGDDMIHTLRDASAVGESDPDDALDVFHTIREVLDDGLLDPNARAALLTELAEALPTGLGGGVSDALARAILRAATRKVETLFSTGNRDTTSAVHGLLSTAAMTYDYAAKRLRERGPRMDEIDIENWWMVGANGRGEVSLANPPLLPMSRENALVLAAWLVAVADRDERFGEILDRVRNT